MLLVKVIKSWQMLVKRLPVNIHNFCRIYLTMSLANNSNLKRWKITNSELCSLCLKMQTQSHVSNHLSNALNRYTWQHDSIIHTFCNHPLKRVSYDFCLYADNEGFDTLATLFKPRQQNIISTGPQHNTLLHRARLDVAIKIRDELTFIELTWPYETNCVESRKYKETQYKEIKSELLTPTLHFKLIFLEITSLGFVVENIKPFRNFL